MSEDEILKEIKSKGYWKIIIRPSVVKENRIDLKNCEKIVSEAKVRKRGWDYPYVHESNYDPAELGAGYIAHNFYTSMSNREEKKEIWRMYESGQFIHYVGSPEEWKAAYLDYFQEKKVLNVVVAVYFITEIFLFISNLSKSGVYDNGITLEIELNGVYDRILAFYPNPSKPFREFDQTYQCKFIGPIRIKKTLKQSQLLSDISEPAMDVIQDLFSKFNWNSSQVKEIFRNDQAELIRGFV